LVRSRMFAQSFLSLFTALMIFLLLGITAAAADADAFDRDRYIYDFAELLTDQELSELQSLASGLGKERNTAFIIITLADSQGKDIVQYVEDFYDEQAPGFDQPHGNTAILAINMQERDVYLAGFKKAEEYLDSGRMDQIRNKITPALSDGQYFEAFSSFIQTSYDYMGYDPGVNPENLLFKWWFQLAVSLGLAGSIVGLMAYRLGGRVTVNARTYMDSNRSKVLSKQDRFIRQTVTRQRKPSNDSKGGGGGGGITGGGHSHSGSRGKF